MRGCCCQSDHKVFIHDGLEQATICIFFPSACRHFTRRTNENGNLACDGIGLERLQDLPTIRSTLGYIEQNQVGLFLLCQWHGLIDRVHVDDLAAAAAGVALYQIDELWVVFDKHDLRGIRRHWPLSRTMLHGIIIIADLSGRVLY